MKYLPILLLLLLAQSLATLNYIKTEDVSIFAYSSKYVAKIPKLLTVPTTINSYDAKLVPNIRSEGKSLDFSLAVDEGGLKQPTDRYVFESQKIFEDFSVSAWVEMREDYVRTEVSVTNRARKSKDLDISFPLSSKGTFNIFFPSRYYSRPDNYMVLAAPDMKGPALGIVSSEQFSATVSERPFMLVDRYELRYSLKALEPGNTFTVTLFLYPFYADDQHSQKYPLEFSSALGPDPLVSVAGSGPSFPTDKVDEIRAQVARLPKGTAIFTFLKSVNLSAPPYSSLGTSEYFKQLCSDAGIPCRLVIGERTGTYYAWVEAFTTKWEAIDTFSGVKTAPAGYKKIYTEPMSEFHLLTKEKDVYESFAVNTAWLRGVGERGMLLPIILIVIAAVAVVVVLQLRAGYFRGHVRKPAAERRIEASGTYELLEREGKYDPLSSEVLSYLRESEGRMDIRECSRAIKFSEPLVESAVVFLAEKGVIRRTGGLGERAKEGPKPLEEAAKPGEKEAPPEEKGKPGA